MKFKSLSLVISLCFGSPLVFASPSLVTSGNTLMGVTNVDVAGSAYDVSFLDGTYTNLFSSPSTTQFTLRLDALAAGPSSFRVELDCLNS